MPFLFIITEKASPSGPCKIGVSVQPLTTLAEMQRGNPRPLTLTYSYLCPSQASAKALESHLYEKLYPKFPRNGWFDIPVHEAINLLTDCIEALEWIPPKSFVSERQKTLKHRAEKRETIAALEGAIRKQFRRALTKEL